MKGSDGSLFRNLKINVVIIEKNYILLSILAGDEPVIAAHFLPFFHLLIKSYAPREGTK